MRSWSRVTESLLQRQATFSESLLWARPCGMCFPFNSHRPVAPQFMAVAFSICSSSKLWNHPLSHPYLIHQEIISTPPSKYIWNSATSLPPLLPAWPSLSSSPSWILPLWTVLHTAAWVIHLEPRSDHLKPLPKSLQRLLKSLK